MCKSFIKTIKLLLILVLTFPCVVYSQTYLVDFSKFSQPGGNWVSLSTSDSTNVPLVDDDTGLVSTTVKISHNLLGDSNVSGWVSGDLGWVLNSAATDGLYSGPTGTIVVSGLDNTTTHSLDLVSVETAFPSVSDIQVNSSFANTNRLLTGALGDNWSTNTDGLNNWLTWESLTPSSGNITITITDTAAAYSTINAIRVKAFNSVPVASSVNITGTATVGNILTGNYTYSDVNNDLEGVSTYRWLRGGVAIAGATASTYILIATDNGRNITFEITPVSVTGASPGVAASASISIFNNIAPTVTNDSYTINEDGALIANDADGSVNTTADDGIIANDSDTESDTITVVNPGTYNGTVGDLVIATDGTFSYTPTADANGQDVFNLSVTDNISIVATVLTINVQAVNDQPSFTITGDIDASNQVSILDSNAEFIEFANTIVLGPVDEQNSQSVAQFIVNVISDSADIINNDNISVATNGTLSADMTLNSGTAIIEVSMQDNGGTNFGGIDTTSEQQFTLTYSNFIFDDGFENVTVKVVDYLKGFQQKRHSYQNYPTYDFETDSIEFYGHSLYLNQDYDSKKTLEKIKAWLQEILLNKEI